MTDFSLFKNMKKESFNMLLLILFSGLASCAAQSTPSPSTLGISTVTTTPFLRSSQTTVLPMSNSINNTVAILQTAVQSRFELNGRTVTLILQELHNIIQRSGPNLNFTLNIKNVTKV